MRKVRNRAACVVAIVLVCAALTGLFLFRYVTRGAEWAGCVYNADAYVGGRLRAGTVTDRNGEILYEARDGEARCASDELTRRALLHVIGDEDGNIGTGAILRYAARISGYDMANGLWSPDGKGGTLTLSVDAGASRAALEAMGGRNGAVIVINYRTGELLCAVSAPGFDPENPPEEPEEASGIYLNRGLSSTYTPGSVFKLVTLAAAIENLPDLFERDFRCDGELTVDGGSVTCPEVHGDMKIEDAMALSCNCVFGKLALELGGGTLSEYAEKLGLTESVGIDGIRSARGSFATAPEGSLGLAWSGAGQYETLVCPLAMARLAAMIARAGTAPELTEIRTDKVSSGTRSLSEETAEKLSLIMDYCTAKTYGEGNFPGLDIRAKSGTAEAGAERPHAWFVGFNADPAAPYAFAVILEASGSGAAEAAPVANAVLQELIS